MTADAVNPSDDLPYRVALHRMFRMGAARFAVLEAYFGSLADAWAANYEALCAAGLDARTAQAVV